MSKLTRREKGQAIRDLLDCTVAAIEESHGQVMVTLRLADGRLWPLLRSQLQLLVQVAELDPEPFSRALHAAVTRLISDAEARRSLS